jgi:hypothetical protein
MVLLPISKFLWSLFLVPVPSENSLPTMSQVSLISSVFKAFFDHSLSAWTTPAPFRFLRHRQEDTRYASVLFPWTGRDFTSRSQFPCSSPFRSCGYSPLSDRPTLKFITTWIYRKFWQTRPIVGTIRSYSTSHISLTSTQIALLWDILIILTARSIICWHRLISRTVVAHTPQPRTSFSGGSVKLGGRRELKPFCFSLSIQFLFHLHFHF